MRTTGPERARPDDTGLDRTGQRAVPGCLGRVGVGKGIAMPIRVLLADDHTLFREGLKALLRSSDDFEVVADVSDGREAVAAVERLAPDVALLDVTMPRLNGLQAAGLIRSLHPATRVLILSMHLSKEYVDQAIASGASGYLAKDTAADELEQAIRVVAAGGEYVSPAVRAGLAEQAAATPAGLREVDRLTHRQRQVLRLLAEGATTKRIARELDISVKTVEAHRSQLMDRLDIHDVAGLVRFAVRHGLITVDE